MKGKWGEGGKRGEIIVKRKRVYLLGKSSGEVKISKAKARRV